MTVLSLFIQANHFRSVPAGHIRIGQLFEFAGVIWVKVMDTRAARVSPQLYTSDPQHLNLPGIMVKRVHVEQQDLFFVTEVAARPCPILPPEAPEGLPARRFRIPRNEWPAWALEARLDSGPRPEGMIPRLLNFIRIAS